MPPKKQRKRKAPKPRPAVPADSSRSEAEIMGKINKIVQANKQALDQPLSTTDINLPLAMMQLATTSMLKALYWCAGKAYPGFNCDKK